MRRVGSQFAVVAVCCSLVAVLPIGTFAQEPLDSSTPDASVSSEPTSTATTPTEQPVIRPTTPRLLRRPTAKTPLVAQPIFEPQVTNQTRQALSFYGAYAARATLSQQPRRTRIQATGSRPMFRQAKPFQSIYREPTVSPYLNLHRDESNTEGAPNYHTFVLPQLNQIETNRAQQRELQHLRGQQRGTGTMVGLQFHASEMPGTGTSARYMDTAQFYSGLRR